MVKTTIDFSTFHSRLHIPGRLYLDTPLRIGAGGTTSATEVDLPVVKDLAHRPYIPGSSFKGAFRAHLEAILRAVNPGAACVSIPQPNCVDEKELEELRRKYKDDPAEFNRQWIAKTCWTCRVFGAPWLASKVSFKDMPVNAETWFGRYQERSGVAIDRDTETAGEGLLYAAEAVPTGVEFNFVMVVDNADDLEQGLILLGINEVERGQMALGGARSRGLGWVTLRVDWTNAYRVDQPSLRKYLASGKGESLADSKRRQKLVEDFLSEVGGDHA